MSENVEAEEKTQDRTVTKIFLLLGALNLLTDYEVNQEEEINTGELFLGLALSLF